MTLATGLGALVGGPVLLMVWMRTPYITNQGVLVQQPVSFDHRHHVIDDGLDCRYCHATVETSASAGMPSTSLCMNCHNQIWNSSPLLEPVRTSYFTGKPIEWRRVHDLPEFVYFNHSIHVTRGIGCVTCHGRVDHMAQVAKFASLTMGWCLDCHRNPEPHVRPASEITSMDWGTPENPKSPASQAIATPPLQHFVHCSTCHR